ncbi:glycosyl transferase family 8, partial [Streptococcus agalactiae]|nr:glycosyl transferase family 8 [Streptococcus agalactiae]
EDKYNAQVGNDLGAFYENWQGYFDRNFESPTIIHYCTHDKPWNTFSSSRFRETWWQYEQLDWNEVFNFETYLLPEPTFEKHFFTFTTSVDLLYIEELVELFPNSCFHIAAWTSFGPRLLKLATNSNVRLYPSITSPLFEQLMTKANYYLDISTSWKEIQFCQKAIEKSIPILSFNETVTIEYRELSHCFINLEDMRQFLCKNGGNSD